MGNGATTQSVVGNLGADLLVAFAECQSPTTFGRIQTLAPDTLAPA